MTMQFQVAEGYTVAIYIFAGSATFDETLVESQNLAILDRSAGQVQIAASQNDTSLDCLVLTGEPINEPMERTGPFVMNTRAELHEAIVDYQAGRMGTITATGTV